MTHKLSTYHIQLGPKHYLFQCEAGDRRKAAALLIANIIEDTKHVPENVKQAFREHGYSNIVEFPRTFMSYEDILLTIRELGGETAQSSLNIQQLVDTDIDTHSLELIEVNTTGKGRRVFSSLDAALSQLVTENDINVRWLMELKRGGISSIDYPDIQARFL